MTTLKSTYRRWHDYECMVIERLVDTPVLSQSDFADLAEDNPTGPDQRFGIAAGLFPVYGYWVVQSYEHPGYNVLVKHSGHGITNPVAYCLVD